jgi:autotransporter adhesin
MGAMTQSFGIGSTAIGVNSMSKGAASTSIGVIARSWGKNSLAIGSQAGAYGDKSTSLGDTNMVGFDMTDGTTSGAASSAIGTDNKVYGNNSYVIGGGNTIGSATITETTEANGDKIKKVTAGTVKGSTAGAFGYKNTVTTDNAYVVGNNSAASADGAMVLGSSASVTGKNGVALGNNTKVANENAVAIGNGSETAAAVATPSATINGVTHNFAGVNPASTVSVGKAGAERTITNVAAGRISATSTDAINGSQLYAVTSEVDKGVAYAGDVKAAAAAANKFTRKLGEQTNIIGGVTDTSKLTDGNIGVVSNGTDTLNIKLAKDVKVDSVTAGNTVINNNGLTVGGNTYVTNNGINANNAPITNVASGGTIDSNAANIGDVKKAAAGAKATVTGAKQATVTSTVDVADGHTDYVVSATKTTLAAEAGGKVSVTGGTEDANGVIAYTVGLDAATKTAINNIGGGTIAAGDNKTVTGDTVNTYLNNNYYDKPTMDTKLGDKANTNLDNITNAGKTVINDIAADAVKVVNGKNTTVTPGTENGANGTVKTYAVNVAGDLTGIKSISNQQTTPAGGTTGAKITLGDTTNTVDVGGAKITNVADGDVAPNSKDAVNGGQLNEVKELAGKHTIVKVDGQENRTDGNLLITKTDNNGQATYDLKLNDELTVGKTGAAGKDGSIGVKGKDGSAVAINGKDGSIGLNGANGANGLTIKGGDGKPGVDGTNITRLVIEEKDGTKHDVATLDDGMKYGGDTGAVIKKKLNEQVNVIGGITDTNKLTTEDNLGVVSDGSNNLKVRLAKALKGLESVTTGNTVMNNDGVTINNGAAGNPVSLTKNGLNNGGNTITNVADGINGTDAVNVNQLNTVAGEAAKHTTVKAKDSNVTVTERPNASGGTEYTIGLGDKVTLGTDPAKQVSIDGTTGIIKAGDKVTINGTTGNIDAGKVKINGKDGTVNGLTNKTWDPNNITSGQAATEDQLKEVDNKITNTSTELTNKGMDFAGNDGEFHRNLGEKVTIKGEGTKAASEYSGENIKTFADSNGNLTVKMDKNLKTETIIAAGKDGKNGKIGINGNDGQTTNISVTSDGKPGVDGAPGTTTTRIVYEKPDGTKEEVATLNDGMKYGGDTGAVIKKKLNEQVNVVGGITDTNKLTTEDNLGVVSDGNNNLKVCMAKDLKGLNSVTTNTLTVGDVKIDNSGINAGNKKITNVAAGDISANSTDAVNGGQLWKTNQTINNIGGAVNELGTRVNRVGAGAAALAALHPLDFDPDDKWDVAAGYGNYKDAHAVSVGAFYRPNEDTMFSVGGSFGGGENMVNAGVSVKLGQGNHVSTSRVALAKEVEDLKAIVKAQSAEIKAMRGAMQSGTSVMKDVNFPDVPKDHWAYSYVKSLADRGLLEGYPDGEFKGDRSMTRYEFAAIIYRALQNGAPIDSDMAKAIGEFDPEINRIKDLDRTRVDRISGKDNDRHKVERVRVNNESNKEKGDYRDVYGSHISPEA